MRPRIQKRGTNRSFVQLRGQTRYIKARPRRDPDLQQSGQLLPNIIDMTTKHQLVHSEGIYHGLPTYNNDADHSELTAIVTGANGISGYHMVKVLAAAPERWKKIYCLSRRPPPDYFFSELGDGASRVEHVSSDFLAPPSEIGQSLRSKINRVYVR